MFVIPHGVPSPRGNVRLNVVEEIQETLPYFIAFIIHFDLTVSLTLSSVLYLDLTVSLSLSSVLYLDLTVSPTLSCIFTSLYLLFYLVS